jgi:hypothetical protein
LSGQIAFLILYSLWEEQRIRRIRRAIEDPNTDVTMTYTQARATTRTGSIGKTMIGWLWTIPGLFLVACAMAALFLGLQQMVS